MSFAPICHPNQVKANYVMENTPVQTVQQPTSQGGRPPAVTPEVVQDLVTSFANGWSVTKACEYAGIARRTYYYYCQNDAEFLRKMTLAQNNQLVLAGNRITEILQKGDDRDAGPLAKWLFEKKMPTEYGNQQLAPGANNTQNNFFLLSNEQLGNITKQSGIDESDPTKLLEEVEAASNLDNGAEEGRAMELHQD